MDADFLRQFDRYLLNTPLDHNPHQTLTRNTVNKYHCKIKVMLIQALNSDLIPKSPYLDFKIKDEYLFYNSVF